MPTQNGKGMWEEECEFMVEQQQIGERRNEAEQLGDKKCGHITRGDTCELAYNAMKMHIWKEDMEER